LVSIESSCTTFY